MKLFEKGKDGIVVMKNVNSNKEYDMLIVNATTRIKGPITLRGSKIFLGYNDVIEFKDVKSARNIIERMV